MIFAKVLFCFDYLRVKNKQGHKMSWPYIECMEQMDELTTLPNIGKVVADKLAQIGITTPEELIKTGSEQAFLRIRTIDPTACMSMLQGLEGAIQGIRWHDLPKERKTQLKEFFKMCR